MVPKPTKREREACNISQGQWRNYEIKEVEAGSKNMKQKMVQRPGDVHRGHLIKHCRECHFRKVEQRGFNQRMGETREVLRPQDQRG